MDCIAAQFGRSKQERQSSSAMQRIAEIGAHAACMVVDAFCVQVFADESGGGAGAAPSGRAERDAL